MANIAAVSRMNRPEDLSKRRGAESNNDEFEIEELYWDALLNAKRGNMNAAENFADRLIDLFNSTPLKSLGDKSPDDAYASLARRLGILEGVGIRGSL